MLATNLLNEVYSVAPFPPLPTVHEVTSAIASVERQIASLQEEMSMLESISGDKSLLPVSASDPSYGLYEYCGLLTQTKDIETVIAYGRGKAEKANANALLPEESFTHEMTHIFSIPSNEPSIEDLTDMFTTVQKSKLEAASYRQSLAQEYTQTRNAWKHWCTYMDSYNEEVHDKLREWPPEFKNPLRASNPAVVSQLSAPDIPMVLDSIEADSQLYYNENGLVEDPVKEHEEFKQRVTWTDEDIHIFLERYKQHPREFKRIASALPSKSVGDVIELYYTRGFELNLREIERASRRRRSRKFTSEGTVKG